MTEQIYPEGIFMIKSMKVQGIRIIHEKDRGCTYVKGLGKGKKAG